MTAKTATPEFKAELIAGFKWYAQQHYDEGWDMVVETMTDEEIWEDVFAGTNIRTWGGGTRNYAKVIAVFNERRAEAAYQGAI